MKQNSSTVVEDTFLSFNSFEDETNKFERNWSVGDFKVSFNSFEDETGNEESDNNRRGTPFTFNSFEDETKLQSHTVLR